MAVRKLKPTSAGRRFQTVSDFEEITRTTPEKSLTEGLTKKAGRNNHGRVTSRRRGGGVKRLVAKCCVYNLFFIARKKRVIPVFAEIKYFFTYAGERRIDRMRRGAVHNNAFFIGKNYRVKRIGIRAARA